VTIVDRDTLHRTIDELPDDTLVELSRFVEFLNFERRREAQTDTSIQTEYSQSLPSHQLQEQLAHEATDKTMVMDDNFSWLERISVRLQAKFLIDLLLAVRRSCQSHSWSEVIQVIDHWKTVAESQPPFEPVNFPEGILQGYDFSPEFITETRKEIWAGFGKEPE